MSGLATALVNTAEARRVPLGAALLASAGLVLAIQGQRFLDQRPDLGLDAGLMFSLAAVLWALALWRWPVALTPADETLPVIPGPAIDRERGRLLVTGLALVLLTIIVVPLFTGPRGGGFGILSYPLVPPEAVGGRGLDPTNTFTRVGAFLWLSGSLLCLASLAQPLAPRWWRRWIGPAGIRFRLSWAGVAVLAILGLGAWFRFGGLADVPLEMTSDHTEKVLDVASIVNGLRPAFLPGNAGREPLEFYWLAFLVRLGLANDFMLLKIGMGLVSLVTIPVIYLFGRRVAGLEVGLLAALFMALSYWHVAITRIGLRIAFSPLFVALSLIFLYRALQTGRRNDFLALGICLGAGLYGYSGFRPMLFVVPIVILLRLAHDAYWRHRAGRPLALLPRPVLGHLGATLATMTLVAAPLIRFAIDRPEAFWGRTMTRMLGAEQATPRPAVEQLLINIRNGLLMFNLNSDAAWFQAAPFKPALDVVGGGLLVLALVTVVARVARRDWRAGMLLIIIPVMLLSSIMALSFPDENPSLSRAAGALPAVVVLLALPLPILGEVWRAALGALWGRLVYVAILSLLAIGVWQGATERYFVHYAAAYDAATHNTSEGAAVARAYLVAGVSLDHVYLVGWSNGWDYRALGILLGDPHWKGLLWGHLDSGDDAVERARDHVSDPAAKLYLVAGPAAGRNLGVLGELFPTAVVARHASRIPGKEFWTVYVPARPVEGAGE